MASSGRIKTAVDAPPLILRASLPEPSPKRIRVANPRLACEDRPKMLAFLSQSGALQCNNRIVHLPFRDKSAFAKAT